MSNTKKRSLEELIEWARKRKEELLQEKPEPPKKDYLAAAKESLGRDIEDFKKPTREVKTCSHGVKKGWHCWQCGGLANIGEE